MADSKGQNQLDRAFVLRLARIIKEAVSPKIPDRRWRKPERTAHSGDTSFKIDLLAEKTLDRFLKAQKVPLALYTEDRGLVRYGRGEPVDLLVVDPIDGTRPALAGLESACVSVALARYGHQPRFRDVTIGCLVELKGPAAFVAERGRGVVISGVDRTKTPRLCVNRELERMFWSFELVGRPPVETMTILEPLAMASGLEAGMFLLSSATYSISRILLGQFDAYIDIGARMLTDLPGVREKFLRAGKGRIVCLNPYDIAAAVLLAQEAGCCVTDVHGRSLDELLLMPQAEEQLPSCLVASNKQLHEKILETIDRGFERLRCRIMEKREETEGLERIKKR